MKYTINTLHRGKFIWILLGGLFTIGIGLSLLELQEIVKIIILLFCIPALLFGAVKFNKQSSIWTIDGDLLSISTKNKTTQFDLKQVAYIKNHVRSGGNLIAFHFSEKISTKRFWRNKLFVSPDDFDELISIFKSREIHIMNG
ncbi:MAG: hypothetical protein ACRDE7_12815 [Sphingobacterium sp.]